ncbi:sigma-70 family RNA polymerase sigma factor [Chitinophaga agrisoli]|uniref:Sigma-70 family RNA polymerase sigma factor n=1 Tax=Chitinophaga agrisoli TaxID=2607653 RepID=A0A5B2VYC4_9BACT|nr:sigma-70 family RNA polymerase sigma factor [Chitinophaga agrisoli]KAA2243824.1 sigma-70 family RNA polymerase sigma factor [Chitinophaga agrisoli]
MGQTGDKELISLIRTSDYTAFEELHQRFWPVLRKLAYRKIGDRQEAYDLVQEMFIELWEKRERLNFGDELNGWLHKRLWFKLSTYFRTKGFREKHLEDFRIYAANEVSAVQFDPMELRDIDAYYEDLLAAINKTVEEMPDRMREVFLLNRNERYSVNEIADKLNLSPKTVRNQLDRAIGRLRKSTETYNPTALELLFIIWLIS